ncbi:MAG TPA: polysaccharide pyruvyl transferase family protein [Rhizomicrobium sp.]|jgi:polysaccharide pyruvyl transferase WcaK-like protein
MERSSNEQAEGGVVNVCLYCAIPEEDEFRRQHYGIPERSKGTIRNALNAIFTVLSGRLIYDVHSYKVASGLDDNSNRGDMAIRIALRSQLRAAFAPRTVRFTEVKWGDLARKIADINSDTSLFVIAGGGYISIDGDGSPWAMLANSRILEKLKCPVVACGIGLNRLMNERLSDISELPEETRGSIYRLSKACRALGVRDLETVQLFAAYGQKPAVLTGDPVLYVDSDAPFPDRESGPIRIGINLASHGRRTYSMLKNVLPSIIDFLRWVQKNKDVQFVYMVHHDFEKPIARYLRRRGVALQIVDLPAPKLIEAYKHLDFVINQMLHSCIFAANAGVPFLNIAYDRKCLAFCASLDVPECGFTHDQISFDLLKTKFDHLLENRRVLSEKMRKRRTMLRSQNRTFLKDVVRLVAEKERV